MTTLLKEIYIDGLEYVQNLKKLGGNEKMAEYQTRYINQSTEAAIDRAIEKLNLERFATREDLRKVEHDLEKFKISIESKLFKHTAFTTAVIVLTNLPTSVKNAILTLLHAGS